MDIAKIKSCPQYRPNGLLETSKISLEEFMPLYNQSLRELSYSQIQGFCFLCLPASLTLESKLKKGSERDKIQQIKGLLSISFEDIEDYKKTLNIPDLENYLK